MQTSVQTSFGGFVGQKWPMGWKFETSALDHFIEIVPNFVKPE